MVPYHLTLSSTCSLGFVLKLLHESDRVTDVGYIFDIHFGPEIPDKCGISL